MTLDFLGDLQRTQMCGELRASDAGQSVVVMGWVNRRRDHGDLIFLDVRDRSGITQVVFDRELAPAALTKAEAVRSEYVVAARGTVRLRDAGLANPNMATGEIEVAAAELLILNDAKTLPFSPAEGPIANEEVRLKYRYLDLRREEMQKNFRLRHEVARAIRNYLSDAGFLEIETPFMTRSTPEGARDYLVPSRGHAGEFYALPQSPQIFKQILMVSGFDKYFQIARCFRDEDLRADRQPEFTQIDLEMTFPQQGLIFKTVEGFLSAAFKAAGVEIAAPFVQMTYDEAIRNYGIDKPDMRLPAMVDLSETLTASLRESLKVEQGLPVLGFVIPGAGVMSGTEKRKLVEEIRKYFGDCGLDYLDVARLKTNESFSALAAEIEGLLGGGTGSTRTEADPYGMTTREGVGAAAGPAAAPAAAAPDSAPAAAAVPAAAAEAGAAGPLLVVITPKLGTPEKWNFDPQWIYKKVGGLRLELARKYAEKHGLFVQTGTAADYKFCWVTDFPMYEWNEEKKVWDAAHHPFTSPHEDDIRAGRLTSDKGAVRALAYDIVLNGTELGSGSIRIHRKDVQAEIFRSLGMDEAEQKERFGFFLDALEYGTPPHGGIALGLDRIVMILAGASSLREVIAFPKTAKAIDLMVDAPTPVSEQQMRELSLKTVIKQ